MKRTLCISSSLDVGGAETLMMKIFKKLPEDYKIDFVTSKDNGFYEKEVIELGGKIYRIPLRTKHPLKSFMELKKIVKKNKYESVLKLCDTSIGGIDLLAAKLGGASKLCVRSCNANSTSSKIRKVLHFMCRPFLNFISDVKIAPSELAANYTFGKRCVEKGKVNFLHNAVDLDYYKFCNEDRKKIRKEFNIDEDTIFLRTYWKI